MLIEINFESLRHEHLITEIKIKSANTRRQNNVLKNQCFNEELKEEIRKYLETSENGNTTFQTLRVANKEAHSDAGHC